MPISERFDQRAVVMVELRGTQTDCDLLEQALIQRDWPLLEKRGTAVSALTDGRVRYTFEARFPGAYFRAVTGARERVELLADELQIDIAVAVADRVMRDPRDGPFWYAFDRPQISPQTLPTRRLVRWRERTRLWGAETLGTSDTGRHVRASTEIAARHLATHPLPGAALPPAGTSVRRSLGTVPRTTRPPVHAQRGLKRHLSRLRLPILVSVVCGAWIADLWSQGFSSWGPAAAFVLIAVLSIMFVMRRALPEMTLLAAGSLGFIAGVLVAGVGAASALTAPTSGFGSWAMTVLALCYLVGTGVRLLARQSSWRRVAPWLLPALLPVLLAPFPGLGLTLHAFYLDAYGLNLEDVDVPLVGRVMASIKVILATSLWLIAMALWGYAKHIHLLVKDPWMGYMVVFGFGLCGLFFGTVGLALAPAARTGANAVMAAAAGRTPPVYYGIAPEWVCVRTTGPLAGVPVSGGDLSPSQPYLMLGDAGGTVVLWDADDRTALKAPLNKLRIVPAKRPYDVCK
ncbi:hypothetical protein [Streptomyces syringium]|uniref:hypothetical protein n=1 Tax=Streptomyces syringium TaxID=76729 RepID=UPI0034147310